MLIAMLIAAGLTADGSARTELRQGSATAGQDPGGAVLFADLLARVPGPDATLLLGLSPSAAFTQNAQLFARAFAQLELRLDPEARLRLRQGGGFGTVDLSPLAAAAEAPAAAQTPPVQPPPGSRFVPVQESNSALELDLRPSRRLHFLTSAAWNVSGGADAAARDRLPLVRGLQAHAGVEWLLSGIEAVRADLAAQHSSFSNGRRASVATLLLGWRTSAGRRTSLSAAIGPGVGGGSAAGQPSTTLPYLVAAADLQTTAVRDFSATLGASVEPLGDALTGDLIERANLRASLAWGAPGSALIAARLAGAAAVTSGAGNVDSPRAGDLYLQGELGAALPVTQHTQLSFGVRGALVSRPIAGQPKRQWIAFVGYGVAVPLLR